MIAPQSHCRFSDASNVDPEHTKILKALIIAPNEKTTDLGSLLAIARREACKREMPKKTLLFEHWCLCLS
jgi:hypothetical protein